MAFSKYQTEALSAPLDRRHVKQREQAGRKLSYIEGWQAISEANRIFGFGEWSSETVEIRCVAEAARKIGKQQRDGHAVSYIARVRVTVMVENQIVTREGVGAGHGMDVDLGLAHESAIKESETDARKRALMTFGNPFGLALYDKDQANVVDVREPDPREEAAGRFIADCERVIDAETDRATLIAWWNGEDRKAAFKRHELTANEGSALAARVKARAEALADGGRAAA